MDNVVALQGETASFHDIAAKIWFGDDIKPLACDTFSQTFEALAAGRAQRAMVALENSLFGSINEVYDLLLKHKFWIIGETYLRIEQCLIGLAGTKPADIKEVHSHPIALAQCAAFLDGELAAAKRFEHHDTAASVADVKRWNNPVKAAIASRAAAKLHGLSVLAPEIETHQANYTRFVALSQRQLKIEDANKTSLIITAADKPGGLYQALGAFAKRDINLSKLQSRPVVGRAWHYLFYVDIDAGIAEPRLQEALRELSALDCEIIVLGSYKANR